MFRISYWTILQSSSWSGKLRSVVCWKRLTGQTGASSQIWTAYLIIFSCLDHIRPICLPLNEPLRSGNLVGESALIAGWGSTMFQGPQSNVLRHTQVKIVSTAKCGRSYKPHFPSQVFDDRIICAGASGRDSCQGDSGGPLMLLQVSGHIITSPWMGRLLRFHTSFVFHFEGIGEKRWRIPLCAHWIGVIRLWMCERQFSRSLYTNHHISAMDPITFVVASISAILSIVFVL